MGCFDSKATAPGAAPQRRDSPQAVPPAVASQPISTESQNVAQDQTTNVGGSERRSKSLTAFMKDMSGQSPSAILAVAKQEAKVVCDQAKSTAKTQAPQYYEQAAAAYDIAKVTASNQMAQAKARAGATFEHWNESLSPLLGDALAKHDNDRINGLLDSALSAGVIGRWAPDVVKSAAKRQAKNQLDEAIKSEDPAQLKGAIVAANRLQATDIPEFNDAVTKYQRLKRLPEHWDASKMAQTRRGSKMVNKARITDASVLKR